MENADFLEFELIYKMAYAVSGKLFPVVETYMKKLRPAYESDNMLDYLLKMNDPDLVAKEATENGHADILFDYLTGLLWVLGGFKEEDKLTYLTIAMDVLIIMSQDSWKSSRFSDEENRKWREKFAVKLDEIKFMVWGEDEQP